MKTTLFTVALLTAGLHALNLGSQAAVATTTLTFSNDDKISVIQDKDTKGEEKKEDKNEYQHDETIESAGCDATSGNAKPKTETGKDDNTLISAIGPMRSPMFGNANMGMMGAGSNPFMG